MEISAQAGSSRSGQKGSKKIVRGRMKTEQE